MQNVFFNVEALKAEREIISGIGISGLVLMENAGRGCAKFILRECRGELSDEVVIVTGKGNNAGDGFVIARHLLNNNVKVKLLMLFREKELSGDALVNFKILRNLDSEWLEIFFCKDAAQISDRILPENKVIVDAIFGIGFKGKAAKGMKKIFEFLNNLKDKIIVSIDVPSGLKDFLDNDDYVKADLTLSIGVKKFQTFFYQGRESSGIVKLINMGISPDKFTKYNTQEIYEIERNDVAKILPARKINSNKYSNGKVFILAGSAGLTGAVYLCSMAALRTGSGAVITGVPEKINDIMEVKMTEVMTVPLRDNNNASLSGDSYDDIAKKIKWADAVLIGPGISKNEETLEIVRKIVQKHDSNFVIDADAISAFKNNLKLLKGKKIILTPHMGEFANLINQSPDAVMKNFFEIAKNFAEEYKITLVLKNSPSIVSDGKKFFINSTGSENLATAGTGDVLSGIIVSLLSQTKSLLNSAIAGVFIHGNCGDNLLEKYGASSLIAGDLINEIPKVKNGLSKSLN